MNITNANIKHGIACGLIAAVAVLLVDRLGTTAIPVLGGVVLGIGWAYAYGVHHYDTKIAPRLNNINIIKGVRK